MKKVILKRFETLEEIKKFLNDRDEENGVGEEDQNIVLFDTPDYASAFIGITLDRRAIYDYNLMIQDFSGEDPEGTNLSEKSIEALVDATEFIDYNTVRGLEYYNEDGKYPIIRSLEYDNEDGKYPIIINLN